MCAWMHVCQFKGECDVQRHVDVCMDACMSIQASYTLLVQHAGNLPSICTSSATSRTSAFLKTCQTLSARTGNMQ